MLKSSMQKIGDLVKKYQLDDTDKYVSREFQKYAYDLAVELNDLEHKSLYMRLCKNTPRSLIERARTFVSDAQNARSKGKLFMWKLKELKSSVTNSTDKSKE